MREARYCSSVEDGVIVPSGSAVEGHRQQGGLSCQVKKEVLNQCRRWKRSAWVGVGCGVEWMEVAFSSKEVNGICLRAFDCRRGDSYSVMASW